jgi:hypothetical protein
MTRRVISYGERAAVADTVRFSFDELGGQTLAAGVWTGKVIVPANSVIIDVILSVPTLWNSGTSAVMDVGDVTDPDGFYSQANLKATDFAAGESASFAQSNNVEGAYVEASDGASAQVSARVSTSERVVTATLTTVGTVPTTGLAFVTVVHSPAIGRSQKATFLAT